MTSAQAQSETDVRGPVVVVTGPTASGKSSLAVALCQQFGGEIVNADSMQVYRYMDIGTAKPSAEERAAVPHHVFDVVSPAVRYSAGRYAARARTAAAAIHARGRARGLNGRDGPVHPSLSGWAHRRGRRRSRGSSELWRRNTRRHWREEDAGRLHRRLEATDPEAARRIHPNDARRVIRALEIQAVAGEQASSLRARHAFADRPYPCLHMALDPGREELNARIDARCEGMIEQGLLQEVRALRARGFDATLASMRAIGYRHINPVADGVDTLPNALAEMQRDTRQFARRQRTWLRSVSDVRWFSPAGSPGDRSGSRILPEAKPAAARLMLNRELARA